MRNRMTWWAWMLGAVLLTSCSMSVRPGVMTEKTTIGPEGTTTAKTSHSITVIEANPPAAPDMPKAVKAVTDSIDRKADALAGTVQAVGITLAAIAALAALALIFRRKD